MYLRAWLHLGLGERAAALDALRAAVHAGEPGSVWMSIDAFLAPLRDDPRFRRLLDEAGRALPIAKAS